MSTAFVLDCSMTIAWLFREETSSQTKELLRRLDKDEVLVPALWFLEVANVLALAERKGRITPLQTEEFVADLSKMDIETDALVFDQSFGTLMPLCRSHRLTSYDAVYLELAIRRKLPLATVDQALREAAEITGVAVLGI